jgi:hypothetical protein
VVHGPSRRLELDPALRPWAGVVVVVAATLSSPAKVVPVYTARTVLKSLAQVLTTARPDLGACHRYQTDASAE